MAEYGIGDIGDIFSGGSSPTFSPEALFPSGLDFLSGGSSPTFSPEALFPNWGSGLPSNNWDFLGGLKSGAGLIKDLAPFGALGKTGFDAWQTWDRAQQMSDYNKAYADWVNQQNAYIKQKQQWEADFMKQFGGAQEKFAGAQEEFQGQLGAASEMAGQVFGEFMKASKPLLAQSQEMMTSATEALARGETPEHWLPIIEQAKQRALASGVQSLISGGMSPEAATAAMQPIVDQQAHKMLLELGGQLATTGLAAGAQGMQGLQGAGVMAQIQGQLAAMGITPFSQEFNAMAAVLGHILGGGGQMVPPGRPSA